MHNTQQPTQGGSPSKGGPFKVAPQLGALNHKCYRVLRDAAAECSDVFNARDAAAECSDVFNDMRTRYAIVRFTVCNLFESAYKIIM